MVACFVFAFIFAYCLVNARSKEEAAVDEDVAVVPEGILKIYFFFKIFK